MNGKLSGVTVALLLTACVSQGKYDDAVKTADDARTAAQRAGAEAAARERECDANTARLAAKLQGAKTDLESQTALSAELRLALEASGKNADQIASDKGSLAAALEQTRVRLEELRRAHTVAEARAALFHQIAVKLERMIGAQEVSIVVRDGRMVLVMPTDVLLDSGRTDIKRAGQSALEEIAAVLKTVPRQFQVAGHTDNVPIQTDRFPSNWELSTSRAVEVVRFLVAHGVTTPALSAAGYGEFDPVASNKTDDGRRHNRRIEITLQPNIDELVAVPETK